MKNAQEKHEKRMKKSIEKSTKNSMKKVEKSNNQPKSEFTNFYKNCAAYSPE